MSICLFCSKLAVHVDEFFTEDVMGQNTFVLELDRISKKRLSFQSELRRYELGATYKCHSLI